MVLSQAVKNNLLFPCGVETPHEEPHLDQLWSQSSDFKPLGIIMNYNEIVA